MEAYIVKFWIRKPDGYWEQREESYQLDAKGMHDEAVEEFEQAHEGDLFKIISVTMG